jgi:hypothetical protein
MDTNQEILSELKKLNNRFFVFNTNPFKFGIFNFLGGTFHSLGTIFGTVIITSVLVYLFSRASFTKSISSWIENTLNQVKWEKILTPQAVPTIQEKNN